MGPVERASITLNKIASSSASVPTMGWVVTDTHRDILSGWTRYTVVHESTGVTRRFVIDDHDAMFYPQLHQRISNILRAFNLEVWATTKQWDDFDTTSPETIEDEDPEWTPDLVPEVWK